MRLASVNIAQPQEIALGERVVRTGIDKRATQGPTKLGLLGLAGDEVSDQKNHGGPDQAVYVYGSRDYDWWAEQLGKALEPGTFGENLTISDLEGAGLNIGDQLHFESGVVLEVAAARIPCGVFAAHMNDLAWVKRFRQASRPGLYCRVLQPGSLQVGEGVRLEPCEGPTISLLETFELYYETQPTQERLERALRASVAIRCREEYQTQLEALLGARSEQPAPH